MSGGFAYTPLSGSASSGGSSTAGNQALEIADLDALVQRFPVATSLADSSASPTATKIGVIPYGYNMTNGYDRLRAGNTGSITGSVGLLNTLNVSKFNALKPSLIDTQFTEFQGTSRGALLVANDEIPQAQDDTNRVIWQHARPIPDGTAGNIITWVDAINGNGLVGKATPGRVYHIIAYCVTAKYIQLHNAASAPADTAVPLFSISVGVTSLLDLSNLLSRYGRYCSVGIYVCASSTHATKTLSVSSDTDIHIGVA